jgi:hypothetical protein
MRKFDSWMLVAGEVEELNGESVMDGEDDGDPFDPFQVPEDSSGVSVADVKMVPF